MTFTLVSKYFKVTNELIWRWAGTHLTQFLCRRCNLQFSDVPLWFAWCCYLSSDLRDQFLLAATRLDASDGSPAWIQYSFVSRFLFLFCRFVAVNYKFVCLRFNLIFIHLPFHVSEHRNSYLKNITRHH